MKWLLAAVAVAVLAGGIYLSRHSVKTTYVNGLPLYNSLPGREFILEKDCYVFKLKAHDTDWALLGARDTVPDLPAEVTTANVGADLPGVRILDVLRTGDHFKLVSVRRDQSRTATRVTFEILLDDESTRKFPRLDAYWIMDHTPEKNGAAPFFLPLYAVPHGKD
jgi:hypothetical protein